jgi:hypothetical protein
VPVDVISHQHKFHGGRDVASLIEQCLEVVHCVSGLGDAPGALLTGEGSVAMTLSPTSMSLIGILVPSAIRIRVSPENDR